MANRDPLQGALDELLAERASIDKDIQDLRRIISRKSNTAGTTANGTDAEVPAPDTRRPASPGPGDARREILELMADGKTWTPSEISRRRGTTPNAASRALKRMLKESPPPVRSSGSGRYKLASPKGDAQGSHSVTAERD